MKKEILPIKTERLFLRGIIASDIQNIYNGLSNPRVIRHYGVSYNSLEATKDQMKWYEDQKQYWWAICSADHQVFYGAAGFNDLSETHKKAEIGLWLLPEYWGKGIMKAVMPLICDYGFNKLNLHRIEGFVVADNQNCKNAMAKLDFELEGTMKDCEMKNGKFISVDIYAKIKH